MNRYILIHRLTGPAILLLLGTVALLHEAHIVSWSIFFPLLLILIGVMKLAERAAMANEPYPPQAPYQGGSGPYYAGQPYGTQPSAGQASGQVSGQGSGQGAAAGTAIVPASHSFGDSANGGKE